ncbi:MAG: RDD family protein, partial [Pseudomonadota bacterium]
MNHELKAPPLARRMASWLYEGMLIFGVVFVAGCVYFIVGGLFGTSSPNRSIKVDGPVLQAFLFMVLGIYFVWLWAKGQTLAMKTWDIAIVDRVGQPITQVRA